VVHRLEAHRVDLERPRQVPFEPLLPDRDLLHAGTDVVVGEWSTVAAGGLAVAAVAAVVAVSSGLPRLVLVRHGFHGNRVHCQSHW
jgi:hypothetical protein